MYSLKKYGDGLYGNIKIDIDKEISDCDIDLMKYLPHYYQNSEITNEIEYSIGRELCSLLIRLDDVFKQFNIETATWGLAEYEKELGILPSTDLSLEERREIIKAKIRGRGTTTKEMIKNTAEAFSGGEVEVIEVFNEYHFIVKFVGVKGVPSNMKSFLNMLETIKPAHLSYSIEYTYVVWGHLKNHKWNTLKEKTWKDIMSDNSLTGGDNK